MPNTRSAENQMRVAERRRIRNRGVKSAVKTFIRKAEQSIVGAVEDAQTLVIQAQRSLDKAASKGVLHPRNAARRKARLMKKLNSIVVAPAEAVPVAKPARGTASRAGSTKRAAAGTSTKRAAAGTGSKRAATSTGRTATTKRSSPRS